MSDLSTASLNYEAEYARKCDELKRAKSELYVAEERISELEELCIEANAIKRTLYVIFGRGFYNE